MDTTLFPTKGNLILAKNTLALSKQGYELLDKKRNILVREMMLLIEQAKTVQNSIETTFANAYKALEKANIFMGIVNVDEVAHSIPIDDSINIRAHSVMGVEIPSVAVKENDCDKAQYGLTSTSSSFDEAYMQFGHVKELTIRLAEIENSVYRLAMNIKKTQKRANALKNVTIPRYEALVTLIQNVLEEKEREEFTRLKVIKKQKTKNS